MVYGKQPTDMFGDFKLLSPQKKKQSARSGLKRNIFPTFVSKKKTEVKPILKLSENEKN